MKLRLPMVIGLLCLCFLLKANTFAAVFTVTNTADSGDGSLRQALIDANGNGVADTINFDIQNCPSNVCTITLTSGELRVMQSVTINGMDARNLIVQRSLSAPNFRIFNVSGGGVQITGMKIAFGNANGGNGGGILFGSNTDSSLDNVSLVSNSAPGLTASGGGVYNSGTLTITNSTFSGNASELGGGIVNAGGTLTMSNTTVSSNTATNVGGILNNSSGTSTLKHITVTLNNVGAGSTGGIQNVSGTTNLRGAIVAQNTAGSFPDLRGGFVTQGFNLIGNISTATGLTNGTNGDIVGTSASVIDPRLNVLADNGGQTDTHALFSNSPARDKISGTAPTDFPATDQRGAARVSGFNADIGAFELMFVATASLPNANAGDDYNQTITAGGGIAPYSFAVTGGGTLPNGLTLATDGTLSGTPSLRGTYNFNITATDSRGMTATRSYRVTINPVILPDTLPHAAVGSSYSQTFTTLGGDGNYSYSLASGTLPGGLAIQSGGLSGTPTTAGVYNFTVGVTDTSGLNYTQSYTLWVDLKLSPDALPTAYVGSAYSQTFSATGGGGSYNYSVSFGALPNGLRLSAGGVLSGNPTQLGSFNFNITATDTANATRTVTKNYSLLVKVHFMPTTLPNAVINQAYFQTISVSGASPSFSATGLPNGLMMLASGLITGTPTVTGGFTVTVTATLGGSSDSFTYNLFVRSNTTRFVVNTNDSGAGSLRQAILNSASGDSIGFNIAGCPGGVCTINLTSGELVINKNLIIGNANAKNLIIRRAANAGSDFRVFNINAGFTAQISGMTITGGRGFGGGGILNDGTLTLTDCYITGNTSNLGAGYFGGGIYNTGTLTINRSTLDNNTAYHGGGIYNTNKLTLVNSTIFYNSAVSSDLMDGKGGGIYSISNAAVEIASSTISYNVSDAGGIGIHNQAATAINIRQSIVSQNQPNQFSYDVTGSFLSGGNNFIGIGDGASGFVGSDQVGTHDLGIDAGFRMFGYFGGQTPTFYLQPGSPTINQISGTAGIDFPATDQRGTARPVGGSADIGAVEFTTALNQSLTVSPSYLTSIILNSPYSQRISATGGNGSYSFVLLGSLPAGLYFTADGTLSGIPTALGNYQVAIIATDTNNAFGIGNYIIHVGTTLTVTNTADSGAGSLRDTIYNAGSDDTIIFNIPANDAGCVNGVCTITLTSGELWINKNLTINGTGASNLIVKRSQSAGEFRIFDVVAGATVRISSLTISGGRISNKSYGGGIYNGGTLTLIDSIVSNNLAGNGGGIGSLGALNLTNSTVSNNSSVNGGGIANLGTLNLTNSTVSNNSASGGGGIYSLNTLSLINSTVSNNTANLGGGGIVNSNGVLTINNSTISDNQASTAAGILTYNQNATVVSLKLTNSTISNNRATDHSGGVWNYSSGITSILNTIIAGNTATNANPDVNGEFSSQGNNLIGNVGSATGLTNGTNNDIVGNGTNQVNARLAPLGNYGGATQTLALLPGSPALNAGNDCVLTSCSGTEFNFANDQRGALAPRKIDTAVDIGAFESSITQTASGGAMTNGIYVLPTGAQTANYSVTLSGSRSNGFAESEFNPDSNNYNSLTPFTFEVLPMSGQGLPPGLTLDANSGVLSGRLLSGGNFTFTVKATDADGIAGVQQYSLQILGTTAATVSISGRVFDSEGRGVFRATVSLTDSNGSIRTVRANPFGNYRFDSVVIGETYVVFVRHKQLTFNPQAISPTEDISDLNFISQP